MAADIFHINQFIIIAAQQRDTHCYYQSIVALKKSIVILATVMTHCLKASILWLKAHAIVVKKDSGIW